MVVTNAKYSTSVKSYAAVKTQVTNQVKNGWQQENGSWYYFNDGQQQKGWLQGGDDWYYFNNDGVMQTSWLQGGNDWYYFNPTSGRMQKSWLQGGKDWYYFNPTSGHMQTGTVNVDGKKYSFKNDGRMIKDTWGWPFPSVGEGYFSGAQLFGVNPGGEFRMNGFHDGLDFGSIDHPGSAVHAVHSGVVTQIGYIAGLENYVVVRSDEYTFVYQEAFSNKGNISVKVGQQINTGDVIGYRDTSHLHLGITRETNVMKAIANSFNNNGTWLDPRALIKNGIANQ
ncbi:MAG: peptidoglycan DD-metalloendopeptidase family protein [Ligilactobacillus salivarius]|nr:peptidoglycan DD-metalloendopeptidase family protein [Ligilactobacillus salivarius]